MAFSNVDIQVVGAKSLRARLQRIRELPDAIRKDDRVQNTLVERTRDRFRTKKGPDGRRWKALSRVFFKRRFNNNRSDILVDSGKLRDSIGLTGSRGTATGIGFRIGITDQQLLGQASVQQTGGRSPLTGGRIPARPFIGISRQDVTIVERLLGKIAREQIR